MPRVSEPVDDTTSLDASRIDIDARIGWLLRINRVAAGLSLREMSAALLDHGVSLSAASLSRIETEGHRSVPALDGYSAVTGLPAGALRVVVDLISRGFSYGPATHLPPPVASLEQFSEACRAVHGDTPSASEWLTFARLHGDDTGFGLPAHLMEPCVRRLSLELCRSIGMPRFLRYEALLLLRSSAYGELVLDVVRDLVADPATQVIGDLVNAVTERPTPALVEWTAGLLGHPSLTRAQAATYALQGMLGVGHLTIDDWRGLAPAFRSTWLEAESDTGRRDLLAGLWMALPPPLQEQILDVDCRVPAMSAGPRVWTRSRQNQHYSFATRIAHRVCAVRGLPDDPMLARLLFESMFDPRGLRKANATFFLPFTPYAADLVRVLLAERDHGPDAASRAAITRVAAFCHLTDTAYDVSDLLDSPDRDTFRSALRFHAHSGQALPDAVVARGLHSDAITAEATLAALGLYGDPRLEAVAADDAVPRSIRAGAGWWLNQGPRTLH